MDATFNQKLVPVIQYENSWPFLENVIHSQKINYKKGKPRTVYVGSSFMDNSKFSFVDDQNVRVGKLAMPIMKNNKVEGVMVWEETIDK